MPTVIQRCGLDSLDTIRGVNPARTISTGDVQRALGGTEMMLAGQWSRRRDLLRWEGVFLPVGFMNVATAGFTDAGIDNTR